MIFRIFKNRNICESPTHQEASNKISSKSDEKQRSYSNFSDRVKKMRNFRNILLPGHPIFDFFTFYGLLKVHDEKNRMAFV